MKKLVTFSLITVFGIVILIFAFGLFINPSSNKNYTEPAVNAPVEKIDNKAGTTKSDETKTATQPKTISLAEVAKHSAASDCWMIVSGKAYNVTSYLDQHPAGAEIMISYCGNDATVAYDTKGGKGDGHSKSAQSLLDAFYLGNVK